jgi:hypothetical protein
MGAWCAAPDIFMIVFLQSLSGLGLERAMA